MSDEPMSLEKIARIMPPHLRGVLISNWHILKLNRETGRHGLQVWLERRPDPAHDKGEPKP